MCVQQFSLGQNHPVYRALGVSGHEHEYIHAMKMLQPQTRSDLPQQNQLRVCQVCVCQGFVCSCVFAKCVCPNACLCFVRLMKRLIVWQPLKQSERAALTVSGRRVCNMKQNKTCSLAATPPGWPGLRSHTHSCTHKHTVWSAFDALSPSSCLHICALHRKSEMMMMMMANQRAITAGLQPPSSGLCCVTADGSVTQSKLSQRSRPPWNSFTWTTI